MILLGDCCERMPELAASSVDLIYIDPPFYTQKTHRLSSRDSKQHFIFDDVWMSADEYREAMRCAFIQSRRLLKSTGSIFVHCDRNAEHHLRFLLDEVFGADNFQSEIIWSYKRWSNAKRGLLGAHQTIYFYSKTHDFKFNPMFTDYSPTTNVDQILQKRARAINGRAIYKRTSSGDIEFGGPKRGVPLTDVWEMPYLNPKAAERTGYPTQKPLHLIERIIQLTTDSGDMVLDPFCGSGTTLVAAQNLNRHYVGIDKSEKAVQLTERRLLSPVKSRSSLLENGESSYLNQIEEIRETLKFIDAVVVERNKGIDGFLRYQYEDRVIPVRIQRSWETPMQAINALKKACIGKGCLKQVIVITSPTVDLFPDNSLEKSGLVIIYDLNAALKLALSTDEQIPKVAPTLSQTFV